MGHVPALRRAKGYVFKWAPNPALADPCGHPFSNLTVYLQKPENFKSRIKFRAPPTMQKSRRVTSPCCNVVLETMPVKLHGRSHPVHRACKDGLPYGSRTPWMSRVEGVRGFLMSRVEGVQRFLTRS